MNSLPTIEQYNQDIFLEMLRKADPELFMIKRVLNETGVNPEILPRFIRALYNLAIGTAYGKVQVFMQNGVITAIKSEESDLIDKFVMDVIDKQMI